MLVGATLSGADFSGVDLSTANLKDAGLDGALLCKTKMPWGEENSGCKKDEKTSKQPATQKSAAKDPVCIKRCVDIITTCALQDNMKPEACGAELTLCLKGC